MRNRPCKTLRLERTKVLFIWSSSITSWSLSPVRRRLPCKGKNDLHSGFIYTHQGNPHVPVACWPLPILRNKSSWISARWQDDNPSQQPRAELSLLWGSWILHAFPGIAPLWSTPDFLQPLLRCSRVKSTYSQARKEDWLTSINCPSRCTGITEAKYVLFLGDFGAINSLCCW